MNVLVTGTSGFLGGALGRRLRDKGHWVCGLSRSPARDNSVDLQICTDLTMDLPEIPQVDAIVHCAALTASWASPRNFFEANVLSTQKLIEFARRTGHPHFFFVSSTAVYYENKDQWDLTEESPLPKEPINEYARTKRMAEELVGQYTGAHTIFRPRAIFGPGDSVLFPRILRAAKAGKFPLIKRMDSKPVIGDLIYIENLTDYIEKAIELKIEGIFNLTNSEPVEVVAFLKNIFSQLGYPEPRREVSLSSAMTLARAFEWGSRLFFNYREPPITRFGVSAFAYSKTFDVSKACSVFGAPKVSNQEGAAHFVDWWKNHAA